MEANRIPLTVDRRRRLVVGGGVVPPLPPGQALALAADLITLAMRTKAAAPGRGVRLVKPQLGGSGP